MKKIVCIILSAIMLLCSFSIAVAAEETDKTYYPTGMVILNEEMYKNDIDAYFKQYHIKGALSWNEETGRVLAESASGGSIGFYLNSIPKNLDYYTVSVDVYVTKQENGGTGVFNFGINCPESWAKGDFFQLRLNKDNSGPYVVVYKKSNWGKGTGLTGYVIGESKVNLTIKVGPEAADFYYDGNLLTSIARADFFKESGVPYFESHPNCAFELDNLTVYSGIGEPSTAVTPVISQIDPANAPTMRGYQLSTQTYTKGGNEVFDIRFVASGDATNRQNVGFIVTADAQGKAWNENTTSVFSSLSAETSEGIPCQPITASQYEAKYVCAMAVKAIPVGTDITFCVTPYATDLNGNLIYGATVHYTVNVPATA